VKATVTARQPMPRKGRTESNSGIKTTPTWGQVRFKTGDPYIQWKANLPPYSRWVSGSVTT